MDNATNVTYRQFSMGKKHQSLMRVFQSTTTKSGNGNIFENDVEYSMHLLDSHNDLSLLSEKK